MSHRTRHYRNAGFARIVDGSRRPVLAPVQFALTSSPTSPTRYQPRHSPRSTPDPATGVVRGPTRSGGATNGARRGSLTLVGSGIMSVGQITLQTKGTNRRYLGRGVQRSFGVTGRGKARTAPDGVDADIDAMTRVGINRESLMSASARRAFTALTAEALRRARTATALSGPAGTAPTGPRCNP